MLFKKYLRTSSQHPAYRTMEVRGRRSKRRNAQTFNDVVYSVNTLPAYPWR